MKRLNVLMSFYDKILKNLNEGKGCIYKINSIIDIDKFRNIVINIDTYKNKLDNKNEFYYTFLEFLKNMTYNHNIEKALDFFLSEQYFKSKSLLPFLFLYENEMIFYNISKREREREKKYRLYLLNSVILFLPS